MSKKRPRLWYLYTLNGHIISLGVGFAYYTVTGSPEPQLNNKRKFPRLSFYLSAFFWELVSYKNYGFMRTKDEEVIYETPIVKVIEVEVEKGFAVSNLENPEEGEESDW